MRKTPEHSLAIPHHTFLHRTILTFLGGKMGSNDKWVSATLFLSGHFGWLMLMFICMIWHRCGNCTYIFLAFLLEPYVLKVIISVFYSHTLNMVSRQPQDHLTPPQQNNTIKLKCFNQPQKQPFSVTSFFFSSFFFQTLLNVHSLLEVSIVRHLRSKKLPHQLYICKSIWHLLK